MYGNWQRWLGAALAAAILGGGLPAPRPALAESPPGFAILNTAICVIRDGGHSGHSLNYEFKWFYDGSQGSSITIGGTYSLQTHDVGTDSYRTLFSYPYGFALDTGSVETRQGDDSSRKHRVFDNVRMETTWQIEGSGATGTEVAIIPCTVEPAPPGQEPLTTRSERPSDEGTPTESEVFVSTADPPPYTALAIDTSLFCNQTGGGKAEMDYGLIATNRGVGGAAGLTVAGVIRLSFRGPGGAYSVAQEQPFALFMLSNETTAVDGHLNSKGIVASKLEVEYTASIGSAVDPAAPVRKILRTTACD